MARGKVYNKVYTPEKWELVNEENKNIIEDFLTEYKQQKKSDNTIKQYFMQASMSKWSPSRTRSS